MKETRFIIRFAQAIVFQHFAARLENSLEYRQHGTDDCLAFV